MNYVDAHLHATHSKWINISESLQKARALGITDFVFGGIGPDDWANQLKLKKQESGTHCVFGLHPYYVAENSLEVCEQSLDLLARSLGPAVAVGEVGLDLRPHICGDSQDRQMMMMEAQVELAVFKRLPVVFHVVQAIPEFERYLEWAAPRELTGFIHAYNGSWETAKTYIDRGLRISVGGALCWKKNQKLKEAVKQIPLEFMLLETDSPDQPPESIKGQINEPANLFLVAEEVAQIKGLQVQEVLDRTSVNLRKLLSL